jgi:hypothetical protein
MLNQSEELRSWIQRRRVDYNGYPRPDDQQLISAKELRAKLKELGFDPACADEVLRGEDKIAAHALLAALAERRWTPVSRGETKVKSSNKAKVNCREWLTAEMRASPTTRTRGKEDLLREALDKFPGLTVRSFELAWGAARESAGAENWSKAGRPRK